MNDENKITIKQKDTPQIIKVIDNRISKILRVFAIAIVLLMIFLKILISTYQNDSNGQFVERIFLYSIIVSIAITITILVTNIIMFFSTKKIIYTNKPKNFNDIYIFRLIFGSIGFLLGFLLSYVSDRIAWSLNSCGSCSYGLSISLSIFSFMIIANVLYLFSIDIANYYFVKSYNKMIH